MRFVTLALPATLLFSGALAAQEHPHPDAPVSAMAAPVSVNAARLDRSEALLGAIRSAATEGNAAALRSAADDYLAIISELRGEIGRLPQPAGAEPPEPLAVGRRIALQATNLDSLAGAVPRRLRKDVKRALAAADGLLGTLPGGRAFSESRAERDGQGRSQPAQGPSHGHH